MNYSYDRPLNYIDKLKGKVVIVEQKQATKQIMGKLISFDIHLNIVLEIEGMNRFIKGDSVVSISPTNQNIKLEDKN